MSNLDRTGLLLSGLCLVHCAALPIAAVALPSLLAGWLDHTSLTHWLLLGVAVPVSGYALWRGNKRHGGKLGVVTGIAGIAFMLLGVSHLLTEDFEVPLTLLGATLVATAHLLNLRGLSEVHRVSEQSN